jgi:ribosome biogenesis GTPase
MTIDALAAAGSPAGGPTIGLAELGWDPDWQRTFEAVGAAGTAPARVVLAQRDRWLLAGLDRLPRLATVAGRLRHEASGPADLPTVGDWVVTTEAAGGHPVVQSVLPRRTAVRRTAVDASRRGGARIADEQVLAANVDVVFVVAGLDRDFNLRRIERYLAVAWAGGARPVVLLNKADLDADLAGHVLAAEAVAPGTDVLPISARTGSGLDGVRSILGSGTTAVVLGSSGVGKSTLLNALLGHARQATAAVRSDDDRGRHTTTARELIALPAGGLVIDTPGLRALEVIGADAGLDVAFADIAELAAGCRFNDCRHEGEPGCAVRQAIDQGRLDAGRLEGHRKLQRELAYERRRIDPRAEADERRRWKHIHKALGRQMRERYADDDR